MPHRKPASREQLIRREGLAIIERVLGRGERPILGLYLFTAVAKMLDDLRKNPRFGKISPHIIGTPSILRERPGISQSELARYLGCTRATAGKQVVACVSRGWVRRVRSADDRRSYLLELTASGRRMLDEVADIVAEHEEWMTASLPVADRAHLRTLLHRFIVS